MTPKAGPCSSHIATLKPRVIWLAVALLSLSATHTRCSDGLDVPRDVILSANRSTQQLSISWLGGSAGTFDLIVLRTEFNGTAFYGTVMATQEDGRHHCTWTSAEPLECTSLSVRLRARDGQKAGEWSDTQILQGMDLPSKQGAMMFPQDPVVLAGGYITVCCIVGEGRVFGGIRYNNTVMNVERLSRRSYAATKINQMASRPSGTNVICSSDNNSLLTGTVVFVGYPPKPKDLVCETRDLTAVICKWKPGNTHLVGPRKTRYSLNGRECPKTDQKQPLVSCGLPEWTDHLTMVAQNPLGQASLSDSALLTHRVHPVAPGNLTAVAHAWNATLLWGWEYLTYNPLALICQVEIISEGHTETRNFSGMGLRSAALLDLVPATEYQVRVCCGAQQNFWKWGSWSKAQKFTTGFDVPEAPSFWVSLDHANTGKVMWRPLTRRQSHGEVTAYALSLWSPEDNTQHTETLPPWAHQAPINLTRMAGASAVMATFTAQNAAGVSPIASVAIPQLLPDAELPAASRVAGAGGGIFLSWPSDANASRGFVVEWKPSDCRQDCPVDWVEVAAGGTNVSIAPDSLQAGVQYTISLYGRSPDASLLLQRWEGFSQELVPFRSVPSLTTNQEGSDIQLTWQGIPLSDRRGFILGYRVYLNTGPQLKLIDNLSDPHSRGYTVKNLPTSSYKFTVRAYNSAGEDVGSTVSITMESNTDWLVLEILASLGTMTFLLFIVTFVCYKKRKWVKKAFYPDIPEPKLPGDWTRTQGTLAVKPQANSVVHIVKEEPDWDSSKEKLVVIPEEDEDEERDEPMAIRYYNQVVDERPIRPRYPDSSESSASSLDSARTDVTYTGIQTSGSSLAFQGDPQRPAEDSAAPLAGGGGGYRPQAQQAAPGLGPCQAAPQSFPEPLPEKGGSFGGYKPQCSWQTEHSPGESDEGSMEAASMGSPTSVASTQFLLPQEDEDQETEASSLATTWLHNLLSSTKP